MVVGVVAREAAVDVVVVVYIVVGFTEVVGIGIVVEVGSIDVDDEVVSSDDVTITVSLTSAT